MTVVESISIWNGLIVLTAVWLCGECLKVLNNLFRGPLARYPGPQLAKCTTWYKTWQELILSRSWPDVLSELHNKYGEVVCVGPNEVLVPLLLPSI